MSHKETSLELPEKGVVLVTGANGSGKSSLAESVATAVWGKTLRGSSPWVKDTKGQVSIEAVIGDTTYTFNRSATKAGKASASFEPAPASYSTNTKTQEAIDDITGPFDAWKRCSVFSSQDAAHFTLSTDAERKRLLETLLGLDKFDTALGLCRSEAKVLHSKIREIEESLIKSVAAEDFCKSSIEYNKEKYAKEKTRVKHSVISDEELAKKKKLLEERQEERSRIYVSTRQAQTKLYGLRAERDQLRKDLNLYEHNQCPTCNQSMDVDSIHALKEDKSKKLTSIETEMHLLVTTVEELENEDTTLRRLIQEGQSFIAKEEAYRQSDDYALINHLEEAISKSESELAGLRKETRELRKKLENVQYDLALNENTQAVLGTKGVRSHILTSALEALEVTANKWLKKVTNEPAKIKVRPYVLNKTGGKRDAISLEIEGLGKGSGYNSLSGGQRRRVDVAILLGLAELAQAAKQGTRGTVFFDEVFDSLDEEGVSLVSGVIEEMAEERPIVIISHAPDFIEGLSVNTRLHVHKGHIEIM